MEKLYQRVHVDLCGKPCDSNAQCSCGTISGLYQCACSPGYYGSGDPGKCWREYIMLLWICYVREDFATMTLNF